METRNYSQHDDDEPREARPISAMLRMPVRKAKTVGGINSPFNDAVAQAITFLGDDKPFRYWCGKLRGMPVSEIHALMSKAKGGNRPAALFVYLLKQYRQANKVIHSKGVQKG